MITRILRGTSWLTGAAIAGVVAAATVAAADAYTRADSASMRLKIERIVQVERAAPRRQAPAGLTTPLTQREVNSYLRYDLASQVPVGIAEPVITIVGEGRLMGEALVDLDAVSRANPPKGFFDPMRLLTGRLPVRIQGVLVTSRGSGRFTLEQASVAGVPVPKSVLQTLVSHYSKSNDNPDGVGLDDPFALPAAIREIRVEPGRAIVVQ
ncbi:MAG: hypothetical protein ABIT71_27045 [Vicinamibacteraceae bacterium]